jgi:hypothetical protein
MNDGNEVEYISLSECKFPQHYLNLIYMSAERGTIDLRAQIFVNGLYRIAPTRFSYWFKKAHKEDIERCLDENNHKTMLMDTAAELLRYVSHLEEHDKTIKPENTYIKASEYPPQFGDIRRLYGTKYVCLDSATIRWLKKKKRTKLYSFIYPDEPLSFSSLAGLRSILSQKVDSKCFPCAPLDNIYGDFNEKRDAKYNINIQNACGCNLLKQPSLLIGFYPEVENVSSAGSLISALYPISIYKSRMVRKLYNYCTGGLGGQLFEFDSQLTIDQVKTRPEIDNMFHDLEHLLTYDDWLNISLYFEPWLPLYDPHVGIDVSLDDLYISKKTAGAIKALDKAKRKNDIAKKNGGGKNDQDGQKPESSSISDSSQANKYDEEPTESPELIWIEYWFDMFTETNKVGKKEALLIYHLVFLGCFIDEILSKIQEKTKSSLLNESEILQMASNMHKKASGYDIFNESRIIAGLRPEDDIAEIWGDRIIKSKASGLLEDILKRLKLSC